MPLLSMTGYGDARHERADHALSAEVRTINSRHFKLNLRTTDGYGALEARIEAVVRQYIRRGTINVNIRIRHISPADDFRVNAEVLHNYVDQLQKVAASRGLPEELRLEPLAQLPGVIEELSSEARDAEAIWPLLEPTLREALENLGSMRSAEGQALGDDLVHQCQAVESSLQKIAARSPVIADLYRRRLKERIDEALAQFKTAIEPVDLVREVCVFADRSDISEEIVRLRSHLQQFAQAMQSAESAGRKLEFICQEMGRETNTIGSKANDAEISQEVVEIKTALERLREQLQNVE
ncbi:MAG TPA: YicC/YloC family endoribonuclease [Lacipirellulaceae bacterium]|nr:YicC/YloC family endoribonuclease [Lacipirellulaceae bacterium]